jgi:hypothetical protein
MTMSDDQAGQGAVAPEPAAPVRAAPTQPFAPIAREPWVNPAKRAPLVLAAILVALLLCGGSFAIGVAVGHHRGGHRSGPQLPIGPYRGPGFGRPGRLGPRQFPPLRNIVPPPSAPAPSSIPTPGQTHS